MRARYAIPKAQFRLVGFVFDAAFMSRIIVGRVAAGVFRPGGRPGAAGGSPLMNATQARWTCFASATSAAMLPAYSWGVLPDQRNVEGVVGEAGEMSAALGEVEAVHKAGPSDLDVGVGNADGGNPVFLGGDCADASLEVLHVGVNLFVVFEYGIELWNRAGCRGLWRWDRQRGAGR